MASFACFQELGKISEEISSRCVLTTTMCGFSKCGDAEFSKSDEYSNVFFGNHDEYVTDDDKFKFYFLPKFFPNGSCNENKGYVSILFYGSTFMLHVLHCSYIEFHCTAAVIDAAGNKRFLQTFTYVSDCKPPSTLENDVLKFGVDKYVKRDTLLSEPSELLPGDCLTLHMEIDYLIRIFDCDADYSVNLNCEDDDEEKYCIDFDSPYTEDLCKVSKYFQRLLVTPMIESKKRLLYVPPIERGAFDYIYRIINGANEIKIVSMPDICEVYVVADKYDIQPVIETCRELVKSFLCAINEPKVLEHTIKNIPRILELAEEFSDESLKEILAIYLENKEKFEANDYEFRTDLKNKIKIEWSCQFEEKEGEAYFRLTRTKAKEIEPQMEFYK